MKEEENVIGAISHTSERRREDLRLAKVTDWAILKVFESGAQMSVGRAEKAFEKLTAPKNPPLFRAVFESTLPFQEGSFRSRVSDFYDRGFLLGHPQGDDPSKMEYSISKLGLEYLKGEKVFSLAKSYLRLD